MSINKEPNSGLAERIKVLRNERQLNQAELALDFSRFIGRKTDYSVTTLSAWELGRKTPPLMILYKLAEYFDCSVDYLCGMTNDRNGKREPYKINEKAIEERDIIIDESKLVLRKEDYRKYNHMPVFVTFKNMEMRNQWGLLNLEEQCVMLFKEKLPLGQFDITLYVYPLPNEMYFNFWKIHAYSLPQMMQATTFWVEVYSYDEKIKGMYNGWYSHNENHSAIVNCNNGLTLPYTGLNVSYVAYHSPSVNF